MSVKASALKAGANGGIALPVLACLPGVTGGWPWHDAHDHSLPCVVLKKA
jgi:hypothetical protein